MLNLFKIFENFLNVLNEVNSVAVILLIKLFLHIIADIYCWLEWVGKNYSFVIFNIEYNSRAKRSVEPVKAGTDNNHLRFEIRELTPRSYIDWKYPAIVCYWGDSEEEIIQLVLNIFHHFTSWGTSASSSKDR